SRLGVALRRQGDLQGALAQFKETLKLAPKDPEAHYNVGMALKAQDDVAGAIEALRQAVTLKPDFEKARYNLGILLRGHGQQTAAEAELREGEALQNVRLHLARAKNLSLQGAESLKNVSPDEALEFFIKAVEEAPDLPTPHYFLGTSWEKKGDSN